MADATAISDYTTVAGDNVLIDAIDIDEGWSPADVNNAFRALMSHLAEWYQGSLPGIFTDLTVTGDTIIGDAAGDALTFHPSAWTLTNAVTITGTWTDLGAVTTADINGGTIDGVTIGGASAPTVTDLGSVATCDINGGTIDGVTIGAGAAPTVTDLGSVATCDINGGTIDGVTIGAASAPTVTDLGSVATCDINGGTIDGAVIGGASAAAGSFTTLNASGNVGIGGTSSGAKFTTIVDTASAVDVQHWRQADSADDLVLRNNAATWALYSELVAGGAHFLSLHGNTGNVEFGNNVGIRVTPESWSAEFSALQIAGLGALWGQTSQTAGVATYLTSNAYNDGNTKYIVADEAERIYLQHGQFTLQVAGAGSADAEINWKTPWATTLSGAAGSETITQVLKTSSAGTEATALTLDGLQNVYGKTGTTGMTDGFIFIPAAAGAPSGAVAVTTATLAALYYDTTNKKLYAYNHVANAWEGVTLS